MPILQTTLCAAVFRKHGYISNGFFKLFFFISIVLILSRCELYAQDSLAQTKPYTILRVALGPQAELYENNRFSFAVLPAIERRYGQYSLQLQAGMMMPIAYTIQDTIDPGPISGHIQWYTLRTEFRKYKQTLGKAGLYRGVELFVSRLKTPRNYAGYTFEEPPPPYDAFVLTKTMVGVAGTIGFQRYISNNLLLGMHISMGAKYKYTSAYNKLGTETHIKHMHDLVTEHSDKLGSTVTFASYVSISAGYAFR